MKVHYITMVLTSHFILYSVSELIGNYPSVVKSISKKLKNKCYKTERNLIGQQQQKYMYHCRKVVKDDTIHKISRAYWSTSSKG